MMDSVIKIALNALIAVNGPHIFLLNATMTSPEIPAPIVAVRSAMINW